jgi:hypothetical protein
VRVKERERTTHIHSHLVEPIDSVYLPSSHLNYPKEEIRNHTETWSSIHFSWRLRAIRESHVYILQSQPENEIPLTTHICAQYQPMNDKICPYFLD